MFQKKQKNNLWFTLIGYILFDCFLWTMDAKKQMMGKNRGFLPIFCFLADIVHNKQPNKWYNHQTTNIKYFFVSNTKIWNIKKFHVRFDRLYLFVLSFADYVRQKMPESQILGKNWGFFPSFHFLADIGIWTILNQWYIHQTTIIKIFFCSKKYFYWLMLRDYIT